MTPVLGRHEQFDDRSKEFPLMASASSKPLRSYTWRCNTYLDQGREGACVGAAICHELAARPAESVVSMRDAMRIYYLAQKIDPWPGGVYPGASPRYEGTSVLAGVKIAQKEGWFENYRWTFGLDQLLQGIGRNGPAVLGLKWYSGMSNTNNKGFIKPIGGVVGGHAILCRAINVKEEYLTLRNSWGRRWGVNGDCKISFADMGRLLQQGGEAVFFTKRNTEL